MVRRQSEFNKAEKARLLQKSKKNYAPPEQQPGYIPVLPKLSTREPGTSSSGKSASSTGARKAKADHSPEKRGRKRERSSSYYSCSSRDSVLSIREVPPSTSSPRRRSRTPRSPPRTPTPRSTSRRISPPPCPKKRTSRHKSASRSLSVRKSSPHQRHSRTLSLSSSSKQQKRKEKKKQQLPAIPGLHRSSGTSTTRLHSHYFSPRRRRTPSPRPRTRSLSPRRSPSWTTARRRDRRPRSHRRDQQ